MPLAFVMVCSMHAPDTCVNAQSAPGCTLPQPCPTVQKGVITELALVMSALQIYTCTAIFAHPNQFMHSIAGHRRGYECAADATYRVCSRCSGQQCHVKAGYSNCDSVQGIAEDVDVLPAPRIVSAAKDDVPAALGTLEQALLLARAAQVKKVQTGLCSIKVVYVHISMRSKLIAAEGGAPAGTGHPGSGAAAGTRRVSEEGTLLWRVPHIVSQVTHPICVAVCNVASGA